MDQLLQAMEVRRVDDAGKIVAGLRVGAIELLDVSADGGNEFVVHRSLDQYVVGSDAGLAGVHEFAPSDAAGGDLHVGMTTDKCRALATQLQGHRGQVLGRGAHDDASNA